MDKHSRQNAIKQHAARDKWKDDANAVCPQDRAHVVPSLSKIEAIRMAGVGSTLSEPGEGSIR